MLFGLFYRYRKQPFEYWSNCIRNLSTNFSIDIAVGTLYVGHKWQFNKNIRSPTCCHRQQKLAWNSRHQLNRKSTSQAWISWQGFAWKLKPDVSSTGCVSDGQDYRALAIITFCTFAYHSLIFCYMCAKIEHEEHDFWSCSEFLLPTLWLTTTEFAYSFQQRLTECSPPVVVALWQFFFFWVCFSWAKTMIPTLNYNWNSD